MHVFLLDIITSFIEHFTIMLINESDVHCGISCQIGAELENRDYFALTGEWVVMVGVLILERGIQGGEKFRHLLGDL